MATYTEKQQFEPGVEEEAIKAQAELLEAAGAIRTWYEGSKEDGWTLFSEWKEL